MVAHNEADTGVTMAKWVPHISSKRNWCVEIALSSVSDGAKGLELRTCVVQGSVRITRQKK